MRAKLLGSGHTACKPHLDPTAHFSHCLSAHPPASQALSVPSGSQGKVRPLWLELGNVAVLRAPPPALQRTLALCSVGPNSADSLASLGPFLGPPARRTRANEPGLPSLLGHALLGARGQSLSGLLPACSNCTVGKGLSLWASVSPSLQRGAGTSPEKPRNADLLWSLPTTRLASGTHVRGGGLQSAGDAQTGRESLHHGSDLKCKAGGKRGLPWWLRW